MEYFCFGKGRKTLVILPGLSVQSVMDSADAIADAYKLLTNDFTVYLFDRRKDLPGIYSVEDMANDTAEAIKSLDLESVCIFGASQGGMIALEIAVKHPELVERLILGSTSSNVTEALKQAINKWVELAKAKNASELFLSFAEAVYPKDIFEKYRESILSSAKTVSEDDLNRFIILSAGIENYNIKDDLKSINCPVLLLSCKDDNVMGSDAAENIVNSLRDRSDFEVYFYEGFGHAAYDTAPDYKKRMLQFLTKSFNE